jgi:hypothetical protein
MSCWARVIRSRVTNCSGDIPVACLNTREKRNRPNSTNPARAWTKLPPRVVRARCYSRHYSPALTVSRVDLIDNPRLHRLASVDDHSVPNDKGRRIRNRIRRWLRRSPRAFDNPRTDGVNADRLCVIEGRRLGKTDYAVFCGSVGGWTFEALTPASEEVLTIAPPSCFNISAISVCRQKDEPV